MQNKWDSLNYKSVIVEGHSLRLIQSNVIYIDDE